MTLEIPNPCYVCNLSSVQVDKEVVKLLTGEFVHFDCLDIKERTMQLFYLEIMHRLTECEKEIKLLKTKRIKESRSPNV